MNVESSPWAESVHSLVYCHSKAACSDNVRTVYKVRMV